MDKVGVVEVLAMPMQVRRKARHKFVPPNTLPIDPYCFRDVVGMALRKAGFGKIRK